MAQLSNIHLFIIFTSICFIFININKEKSFFILSMVIILYFINDSLRLLAKNTYIDILIFVIKDIALLLITVSILNAELIKNLTSLLKKHRYIVILTLVYLIINFSIIENKILFFSGFYDLFFLFLITFYFLNTKKINSDYIIAIFIFLFFLFSILFLIQIVDINFYKKTFLNNTNSHLINTIFDMKAYNPKINDETGVFIQQNVSIFNNAGRLNHFMVPFFGILLFLYLNTNKKYLIVLISLTFIFIVINSSRTTIILVSLPIIFLLYFNYKEKIFSRKFTYIGVCLFILYFLTILFFNLFHNNKFSSKIQANKILLVIYHNFYEPILSSFDSKRSETASSITGRLKIIPNETKHYLIKQDDVQIYNIIFGNGIGTHSLITKHIDKTRKYILENSYLILIYEYGIIGLLLILYFYHNFTIFVLKRIKNYNILILSKCVLAYPILLTITGYQFYRDYAFQFYFFVLIGLILNSLKINESREENYLK